MNNERNRRTLEIQRSVRECADVIPRRGHGSESSRVCLGAKDIAAEAEILKQTKEFDPGSGRTLAARLTHASRTELRGACFS